MAGPFPGMDPYIESQAAWPDFHNGLIAELRNELGLRLPESYVARVDERIEIANWRLDSTRSFRPDVSVGRMEATVASATVARSTEPVATLEPSFTEILDRDAEELRITWVEIRTLPELELVTAIDVLSPINKSGQGRLAYLEKREALHQPGVNLVDIDLLLAGAPLPTKHRIDRGAYYATAARGAMLPLAEVYRWTVRDPLPRIPVPLRAPDEDIVIDLAVLVNRDYDLGRYARTLRHGAALRETTSLTAEDRAWVEARISHDDEQNG